MTFGEKIRESRIALKLTQKQLADKIGAKHNSISDWENDKNKPDPNTIELLCGVLNISPNYLLNSNSDDFSLYEKELIKKYRALDEHGKELIDSILDKEYQRCHVLPGQQTIYDIISPEDLAELERVARSPKNNFSDDFIKSFEEFTFKSNAIDFPNMNYKNTVQAAHNDFQAKSGEQEKMQEDIANLKRPE